MGASIISCAAARSDCKITAGVDIAAPVNAEFEYAKSFSEITARADVIIDFSNPVVLDDMLSYAIQNKLPCVICTTGYNEEQKAKMKAHHAKREEYDKKLKQILTDDQYKSWKKRHGRHGGHRNGQRQQTAND